MADNEDKTPIEQAVDQALDLFLYAPLGLALFARDNLPNLVERGRSQVNQQVMLAKMMGQFAVQQGEKEIRKRVENLTAPPKAPSRPAATPATSPAQQQAPSTNGQAASANGSATTPPPAGPAPAPAAPPPSAAHLAIPAYDTLSASQVVQRLAGLSRDELEAVREYEGATRGRRTILTKISQLQTDTAS